MKNKIFIGLLALFLAACDSKESTVNEYSAGVDLTYFTDAATTRTVVLTESSESSVQIQVGSTVTSSSDRTFTIAVDPESTAEEGVAFTLPSSTVTIPAGEYVGYAVVNLDYLAVPNEGVTLILNLSGDNVTEFSNKFTLNISKLCASFLAGTHTFEATNLVKGAASGGGSCPSISGTVTWTAEGGGVYSTSDASFGQFGSCYSDSPATGPKFTHLCNSITTTEDPDQYGDTYTYTIVSVNGPVMVINWSNTYGDGGTATITREGGADWQDELQSN